MKKLSLTQEACPVPEAMGTGTLKQEEVINGDSDDVGIHFTDMERWSCHIFK